MEFLSDDPTYPAVGLGVLAMLFLVMLKATQQGKYLVFAGGALALLAIVLLVERLWVTEDERIEDVVYGLAKAVEGSDAERAAGFLSPKCVLENPPDRGNVAVRIITRRFAGPMNLDRLRELEDYRFDYLRVTRLRANAGRESGRGTAECVVHMSAAQRSETRFYMTPPAGMGWSFGLVQEGGEWKVARITPGRLDFDRR